MSKLEARLRDAYRDEADTVTPEGIRGLGEAIAARSQWSAPSGRPWRAQRWGRWLVPLAAAAAVAVIVVVAAVAVPRDAGQSPPKATGPRRRAHRNS
jgi:hypothetical protein